MKILFLIPSSFPYGEAGTLRVLSFVNVLKRKNDVTVLCEAVSGDLNLAQNIHLLSINYKRTFVNRFIRLFQYNSLVKKTIINEKPDIVISNCMYDRFGGILKICKNTNTPIVINSVEWYNPTTFKGGRLSLHWIKFSYAWKRFYPKTDGVIAISRLLEDFYSSLNIKTIRIPTILNTESVPFSIEPSQDGRIRLLFAGTLARTKDSIREFLEAIDLLGNEGNKFLIFVCGPSISETIKHLGTNLYDSHKDQICVLGRIPQNRINKLYQESDFGIFFRPHTRSSNAGFSTKLGEGMSAGTPFIVNETGDIPQFISNGENGFLIKNETANGIANVLRIVSNMSLKEIKNMKRAARTTAEHFFNSNVYEDTINSFLNTVKDSYE